MNTGRGWRKAAAVAGCAVLLLGLMGQKKITPSENAGRKGVYSVKLREGVGYYVYVPESYAEDAPAGIHLFFHGQGGQSGAAYFGQWAKHFLNPHTMIGINMQFADGDNMRDTQGKANAALEAMAQVRADYHVIPGRGVISSFSGGGLPHATLFVAHGKQRGANWPFVHSAAYGSNFRVLGSGAVPMSWFVGLGGQEWNLAGAGLGASQTALANSVLNESLRGGNPDVYLRIDAGKGHSISEEDVAASAAGFARSDLAYSPFIWVPDFAEREVKPIAEQANRLLLGKASVAVEALLARPNLTEEVKAKATRLKGLIDARISKVMEISKGLAEQDPVLFAFYGRIFDKQLEGHEQGRELAKMLAVAKADKSHQETLKAHTALVQKMGAMFTAQGKLQPMAVKMLEEIKKSVPEKSLVGQMANDFLGLGTK